MKNMTTVYQKNRFRLLTNGTSVSLEPFTTPASAPVAATNNHANEIQNSNSSGIVAAPSASIVVKTEPGVVKCEPGTVICDPGAVKAEQDVELVDNKCTVIISKLGSQDTNGPAGPRPGTSDVVDGVCAGDGDGEGEEKQKELDVLINNVVCSFSVGCHLNLRQIALKGYNVEYRRESNMITMKLRKPSVTASIWSSGKITCTGATSNEAARIGGRRIARIIQKLGFDTRFRRMRIVNVLGSCSMPFEIRINAFSQRHREAEYEPELHPGVTYKVRHLKATLKIFSTGSITVTAPSVPNVQQAIEHIYPLVSEFSKEFTNREEMMRKRALAQQRRKRPRSDSCSSNDDDHREVCSKIFAK